jgi:hypothetical protein
MSVDLDRRATSNKTVIVKGQPDERVQNLVKEAVAEDKIAEDCNDNKWLSEHLSEEEIEEIIADFKFFLVESQLADRYTLSHEEARDVVGKLDSACFQRIAEEAWKQAFIPVPATYKH